MLTIRNLFTVLAICTATPSFAWDFTAVPVCTIAHQTTQARVVVTYDPRQSLPYAIAIQQRNGTWTDTSPFRMRFDGSKSFTITTDRHRLTKDQTAVTASDTGFDNVLLGLESNVMALAILGDISMPIPLIGAREAVQKFRDCTVAGLS